MRIFNMMMILAFVLMTALAYSKDVKAKEPAKNPAKLIQKESSAPDQLKGLVKSLYISSNQTDDWAVKIDGMVISKKEVDQGFNNFTSQIPEQKRASIDLKVLKKQYLNNLIMQYIVIIEALKDPDLLSSDDSIAFIKENLKQMIYQLYISQSIPIDKKRFAPTPDEMEAYYKQNQEQIDKAGMNAEQIRQAISQNIVQQKIQAWVSDYLDKTKEKYHIERNDKLLKEEGMD